MWLLLRKLLLRWFRFTYYSNFFARSILNSFFILSWLFSTLLTLGYLFREINSIFDHFLLIHLTLLITLTYIRLFLFSRKIFPTLRSYFSQFSHSICRITFRDIRLLLFKKYEETWWWSFRFITHLFPFFLQTILYIFFLSDPLRLCIFIDLFLLFYHLLDFRNCYSFLFCYEFLFLFDCFIRFLNRCLQVRDLSKTHGVDFGEGFCKAACYFLKLG